MKSSSRSCSEWPNLARKGTIPFPNDIKEFDSARGGLSISLVRVSMELKWQSVKLDLYVTCFTLLWGATFERLIIFSKPSSPQWKSFKKVTGAETLLSTTWTFTLARCWWSKYFNLFSRSTASRIPFSVTYVARQNNDSKRRQPVVGPSSEMPHKNEMPTSET